MGGTREVPADVGAANVFALRDLQRMERERERSAAEQRCADLVDGAYRWLDQSAALADLMRDPGFELWAAQAITLRRTPRGATSGELEVWLRAGWVAA